jgi:hypothetical protein
MALDEQLRQLADRVAAPPPGDPGTLYDRGRRRRRRAQAGRLTATVAALVVLGVGAANLIDRSPRIDVADQPPSSGPSADDDGTTVPTATPEPALTLSSSQPFPWTAELLRLDDGRWCVTTTRPASADGSGPPCDASFPAAPSDPGWVDLVWPDDSGRALVLHLAPEDTEQVVVELTDRTSQVALLASDDDVDVTLWAIGLDHGQVRGVEYRGSTWSTGTVVLEDGWDAADALIALGALGLVTAVVVARWARRRRGV